MNPRLLLAIRGESVGKRWNKTTWNSWLNVLRWKGNVLSKEDEHYLLQLDEAIESLDATIAYRNEVLSSRQTAPKDPTAVLRQSWDNIMGHLANLATKETHHLLCKYFDKVVLLQEEKRHL
uniref:kinesin-like protein kif7 n=1 Tax=Myxine glutinosa TaxID=7769 RepID=UPI00358EBE66